MAILQGVWKQHVRPRAVVGYGVKILLPSPPNYVTRSPGSEGDLFLFKKVSCGQNNEEASFLRKRYNVNSPPKRACGY